MIDARLLPLQHRLLAPLAGGLARAGIGADTVTLAGFAFGIGAFAVLAFGMAPMLALGLIALNRLADGLDGAVARLGRPSDRGAFLDIALDFLFYALVPLGFALADPAANALPAAVLLAAFIGTASSFLAFAAIAARRKMQTAAFPAKGIYYLGGLAEGAETIAVFVAMCLFPTAFAPLAYGFAGLCALTTLTRWHWGWRAFSET